MKFKEAYNSGMTFSRPGKTIWYNKSDKSTFTVEDYFSEDWIVNKDSAKDSHSLRLNKVDIETAFNYGQHICETKYKHIKDSKVLSQLLLLELLEGLWKDE